MGGILGIPPIWFSGYWWVTLRFTHPTRTFFKFVGTTYVSGGSPGTVGDLNWEIQGVGDFDGDGKGDILWRNKATGVVYIWQMNGTTIASQGSPATVGDLNWEIQ